MQSISKVEPAVAIAAAAVVLLAALVTASTWPPPTHAADLDMPRLERDALEARQVTGGLEVAYRITNPTDRVQARQLQVEITDLEGSSLMRATERVHLQPGETRGVVRLDGLLDVSLAPKYVLKYELVGPGQRESGSRSLVHALAQLDTRVVTYSQLLAGAPASLRLVAVNAATGEAAEGAAVTVKLRGEAREYVLHTGAIGADGSLDAQFTVPEEASGGGEIEVTVAAAGLGEDKVSVPVTVARRSKILLTTDKPLYQPGQTIEMRALCLRAGDLKPEATQPLLFEVMDSKGNKVFKKPIETDIYGIGSAEFALAHEVNQGPYIVRALLGETTTEKQVTVERYVLPKFEVEVTPERAYYTPGETLKADVQADYFFGKPVAGAKVEVVASKFEIGFETFAELTGELDASGHWEFELPLPAYFAGTPIEQGQASVRLEVAVIDTADHREDKVTMTPVVEEPLLIHAVPEGGTLAPGLDNRVFVLVAYPDGSPAVNAEVDINGIGVDKARTDTRTDEVGTATAWVKADSGPITLFVAARDNQGRSADAEVELSNAGGEVALLLRTDRALYQPGDTLVAEAFTTKQRGTVYFDMIREGQTVMTRAAEISGGKARLELDVDASMSGSAALQAYVFTGSTDIVRDARLLYINPADALQIAVELDRNTYLPGSQAELAFSLTDRAGAPTAGAIGLAIVDESVFALQEIHPGLEKVYFTLEQEIMKPRYEIHGYRIEDIITDPVPMDRPVREGETVPGAWAPNQQRAAEVLLASAPEPPAPPVRLSTFAERAAQADEAIAEAYRADFERVMRAIQKYAESRRQMPTGDVIRDLLRRKLLRQNDLDDPWGNPYEFDFTRLRDTGWFTMLSYGPDGVKGTADDISPETAWGRERLAFGRGGMRRGGVAAGMMGGMGGFGGGGAENERFFAMEERAVAMDMAVPEAAPAAEPMLLSAEAAVMDGKAAGPEPPRIREYFPETLLFEPALIADASGRASLTLDIADSITTWRMTAMASSATGALGSKETPLRVFQDFFVDIDLPVSLTQGDRVSIPVVVYNYLDGPQDVRLQFEEAPWFALDGAAEQTLNLQPEEVRAIYFPIEVKELGKHQLTVFAYGSQMNDAIRRSIEVRPNGEERNVTVSDRLTQRVEHAVTLPPDAIPGASTILVRIYPGVFSQIVDGLDSMLQMPFGCFEQTSSVTYPNVLIVQYLKATEQINPETQMTAEGYINAGYQRLLSYEVDGGGFSWFGDAPANKVLTAFGLKQFADMAEVHEVDPNVLTRTAAWLLDRRESDGSWTPDENYLHAESWTGIQNSQLLVTAYIAEALLSTGRPTSELAQALDYVKAHWQEADDAYTLAIAANALVAADRNDAVTRQALDKLYGMRVEEGETVHWKGAATVTFTTGDAADVEATALATLALLQAERSPETTGKALTWLIRKKGPQGHWGSTQGTILALKALMLSLGSRTEEVDATITVALNGEAVEKFRVTPEDSDVMRLADLRGKLADGVNTVTLDIEGEGSMLYQIVGRHYVPWSLPVPGDEPMTIDVAYDKTELAVDDIAQATATVRNNRPHAAQMVIVDLGIPPGFQVVTPDLDALVTAGTVQKYELTGRQIILYFEELAPNAEVELQYQLRAKFPLRAKTPESSVYAYYNPEVRHVAAPQDIVVE